METTVSWNGNYVDYTAQYSPNSIIVEKGERERMKGLSIGLSLLTETGNEAYSVVEAW